MTDACTHPDNTPLTGYAYGCRCDRCKGANNQYQRDYARAHPRPKASDLGPLHTVRKPVKNPAGYVYWSVVGGGR